MAGAIILIEVEATGLEWTVAPGAGFDGDGAIPPAFLPLARHRMARFLVIITGTTQLVGVVVLPTHMSTSNGQFPN